MSNRPNPPNNPFDRPGNAPHQYSEGSPQQQKSNVWLWVLGTVGVLVVLGALVCCGGGYFAFQAGREMIAELVIEDLQGSPVIEEHIGEIESVDLDLQATAEEQENVPNSMTFDVQGTEGNGKLVVRQEPGPGDPSIAAAVLVLPDGTRHQVVPAEGAPEESPEADEPVDSPEAAGSIDTPEPAEANAAGEQGAGEQNAGEPNASTDSA